MVVVSFCGFLRKIRPTQLWIELSWVVAKIIHMFEGFLSIKSDKSCPIRQVDPAGLIKFKIDDKTEDLYFIHGIFVMNRGSG